MPLIPWHLVRMFVPPFFFGLSVTTFLLMIELGRTQPDPSVVPVAVAGEIDSRLAALERDVRGAYNAKLAEMNDRLGPSFAGAQTHRDEIQKAVAAIADEIDKQEKVLNQRFDSMDKRQGRTEDEITEVRSWMLKIQGTADELMRRQAELETRRAAPQPNASGPTVAERSDEHERQLRMWIDRLKDRNHDVVFTATVKLADLGDVRAALPLVDVLGDHKDFYCRLGAATALGALKAVDAFDALVEALGDKDELVKTAANEALAAISNEDMGFVPDMSRNERTRVQRKWRTWFKANEGPLRDRLEQPLGSGTPPQK